MKEKRSTKKRYFYYVSIVLMSLLLMIYISRLALNYSGYCFKEERYISKEEIIHAAVERLLETYYSPHIRRYKTVNGKTVLEQPKEKNRIYYESVDEFLELNPDCCELERFINPSQWWTTLKLGLKGRKLTTVKIKYKVRYLDDSGEIGSYLHPQTIYIAITNCGKTWR